LKFPLNPPFPKGETPIPLPFVSDPERSLTRRVKGGGEGLFLFQKAKFILKFKHVGIQCKKFKNPNKFYVTDRSNTNHENLKIDPLPLGDCVVMREMPCLSF
jgi:hypothetical protein